MTSLNYNADTKHLFLEQCGWPGAQVEFLATDMSPRVYYRVHKDNQTAVLMEAEDSDTTKRFVCIANHLTDLGLSAPRIFYQDAIGKYTLIEDLGNNTFTNALKNGSEIEHELYTLAIDTLIELHKKSTVKPDFLEDYSTQVLLEETEIFIDWYWLALYQTEIDPFVKADFFVRWKTVFDVALKTPSTVVLRDYHVDNLMHLSNEKCGLLDFQDALWGPAVYDIVSLVEDARRDVAEDLSIKLWEQYLDTIPTNQHSDIRTAGNIISAGRHVKIIGVFTRYAMRQGKKHYLVHISRLWRLIERCFGDPALKDVKDWFDTYVPPENRIIPRV